MDPLTLFALANGREGGKSKFDGVMLMDFTRQELRYFEDTEDLYNDINKVQFNFFSTNKEWGGKLINPGVKLKARPLDKPEIPTSVNPAALTTYIGKQAEYLIKNAQQSYPNEIDLRDPQLLKDVTGTLKSLVARGLKGPKINTEIYKQFPQLKIRRTEPA
jgi:hypothetical protein